MNSWQALPLGSLPMKKHNLCGLILIAVAAALLFSGACAHSSRQPATKESETVAQYDALSTNHVRISGVDEAALSDAQKALLQRVVQYCEAMVNADTEAMRDMVAEEKTYTHMSGKQQSREEYFADVANGRLRYFTIGIENPVIKVDGNKAQITYTSILNANAYGARGTYRMSGTHIYEKRDGAWISVNR